MSDFDIDFSSLESQLQLASLDPSLSALLSEPSGLDGLKEYARAVEAEVGEAREKALLLYDENLAGEVEELHGHLGRTPSCKSASAFNRTLDSSRSNNLHFVSFAALGQILYS